ncbi:MAG: response regulator [Actinomycetota bacterium]
MADSTVLVAEDDDGVRMTIQFVLEDEGFKLLMAKNGEEALELARAHQPDVILLDNLMPKMDGKAVFAELQADERTSSIPVLVMSGMSSGDPGEWPGARFVGKPFRPEELVDEIRKALAA